MPIYGILRKRHANPELADSIIRQIREIRGPISAYKTSLPHPSAAETLSLHPLTRAPLTRRVLGSTLSAWVGWLALNVLMLGVTALSTASADDWYVYEKIVVMASLALVSAAWLVGLLPLYLLVPPRSWLWRWYVFTPCGALAAAVAMHAFCHHVWPRGGWDWFAAPAAFAGGVTCLFASLTSRRFHWVEPRSDIDEVSIDSGDKA
jgi:hypothetical protein